MYPLTDGSLATCATPPPPTKPRNAVTSADVFGDAGWTGLHSSEATIDGLTYPPVWQAIRQISGDGSDLDCYLYRVDGEGNKVRQRSHVGDRLMTAWPNGIQTPAVFKETLWHHALWTGDGRAAILRDGQQRPTELIPLLPDRTWTMLVRDEATRTTEKLHATNVHTNWGTRGQGRQQYINPRDEDTYVILKDADVFHFPGLSYDGISGYPVSNMFSRTFGIGTGAEEKVSTVLHRSGIPPLVLIAPPGAFADEEDARQFLKHWNEYHAGVMNSGKTGLLRDGVQPHQLTFSNRDEQFAELKALSRQDVAAIFNMPIQMLGDTSASSYNNAEQMYSFYDNRTLVYWTTRWEQESARKLLTREELASGEYLFEYDRKPLSLVDAATRSAYYDSMRKNGAFNGNDIRRLEGFQPVDDPASTSYGNPNTSADTGNGSTSSQASANASTSYRVSASTLPEHGASYAASGAVEAVEDGSSTSTTTDAAIWALRLRCLELAGTELERITAAADCKQAETFTRRIDKAYANHSSMLGRVVRLYGGDADAVAAYCTSRKQQVLQAAAAEAVYVTEDENKPSRWLYRPSTNADAVASEIFAAFFGAE